MELVAGSQGRPLERATRDFFEPRLGYDLSRVRVHTDEAADLSARQVGAVAYAVGPHLAFARGRYSPGNPQGRRLLAHELAHVVQGEHSSEPVVRRVASGLVSAGVAAGSVSGTATSETGDRSSAEETPTGGPGGGETPVGTCRVDVRATFISARWMPFRHLFIVHENAAGDVTAYRGGPGGPGGDPTYGSITGQAGPYRPGFVDWDPGAPSVRVASGPAACGKDSSLRSDLTRIQAAGVAYSPTGPNSNTVVRTLLHTCGLPEKAPVSALRIPGWGGAYL